MSHSRVDFNWSNIHGNYLKLWVEVQDENFVAITIGVVGNQFEYTLFKKDLCDALNTARENKKPEPFSGQSGGVLKILPNFNCTGEVRIESKTLSPVARYVLTLKEEKVTELCTVINQ